MDNLFDVIIIGGGAAGMAASLNLSRAGLKCVILEKETFGGQMAISPRIENIPGIKSISGLEMSDQLFEQVNDAGVDIELEDALSIEKENNIFTVKTNYGERKAKAIVMANGCSRRELGIAKEKEFVGKGISYCVVCDGAFYKGQEAHVLGDANSAMQYAIALSDICPKVHMYCLFDRLFGDPTLMQRINDNEKIDVTFNLSIQELLGEDSLTGIRFVKTDTKEEVKVDATNLFVAIGQVPHNDNFKDLIKLDEKGFILTNENMETNVPGIFAIGDTRKKEVKQVATAFGDASVVSVFVSRYLKSL